MNKLSPVDAPCQSNANSDGTSAERVVPDRVGNLLSSKHWYEKGRYTNKPTGLYDIHLSGSHGHSESYIYTKHDRDLNHTYTEERSAPWEPSRLRHHCNILKLRKVQGQQHSWGRSTVLDSGEVLTHHGKTIMVTYPGGVHTVGVRTVIMLLCVTNITSNMLQTIQPRLFEECKTDTKRTHQKKNQLPPAHSSHHTSEKYTRYTVVSSWSL